MSPLQRSPLQRSRDMARRLARNCRATPPKYSHAKPPRRREIRRPFLLSSASLRHCVRLEFPSSIASDRSTQSPKNIAPLLYREKFRIFIRKWRFGSSLRQRPHFRVIVSPSERNDIRPRVQTPPLFERFPKAGGTCSLGPLSATLKTSKNVTSVTR